MQWHCGGSGGLLPSGRRVGGVHVSPLSARAAYLHGASLARGQANNKVSLTTEQKSLVTVGLWLGHN